MAGPSGAEAWAAYGIVEALVIYLDRFLRCTWMPGKPAPVCGCSGDAADAAFVAVTIAVYASIGFALVATIALVRTVLSSRRTVPDGDDSFPWTTVAGLTLAIVFAANVIYRGQAAVLPAILIAIAFAPTALFERGRPWRHRLELGSALGLSLLLLGVTGLTVRLPHLSFAVRCLLVAGFVAGVLVTDLVVSRIWKARRGGMRAAVTIVLAIAASLTAMLPEPARKAERAAEQVGGTNVVLISLDTVRADHLSLYGYERDTTPRLTAWASSSGATVYTRAIASGNWTIPGHASIFTGQSVTRHGARESRESLFHAISDRSVTITQLLSRHGYATGGVVANYGNLSGPVGFERGFHVYDYLHPSDFFRPAKVPLLLRATLQQLASSATNYQYTFASAAEANERAVRFLDSVAGGGRPFFLFVNYMDAHDPYHPPAPFDRMYPGRNASYRWKKYRAMRDAAAKGNPQPMDSADARHLISQYDGGIRYLDGEVAALFDALRSRGMHDNSLIIVTADHGEAFGENSVIGHGTTLYQHQVHVPLIIKLPGVNAPATSHVLASGADILPTILDVVKGIGVPRGVEGRSLLRASAEDRRFIISESFTARGGIRTSEGQPASEIALYQGPLKQLVRPGAVPELYDLALDPREQTNLHGVRPLDPTWESTLVAHLLQKPPGTPAVRDPELLRRLRALGYLR